MDFSIQKHGLEICIVVSSKKGRSLGGFNTKNMQDAKIRRLPLPKSVVGCGKQNWLDRDNFKQPLTETTTSTLHDSSQPKRQEDLHLFQDHIDNKLHIDRKDDVDVSGLIDLFWYLKNHVSRRTRNTPLQVLTQNLNLLEKFLLFFKKIEYIESFIECESQACFSEADFEKTNLQCRNSITCTLYKESQVDSLCLQIKSGTEENILFEHGSNKLVAHSLDAMVGLASDVVEEIVKLCSDSEVA